MAYKIKERTKQIAKAQGLRLSPSNNLKFKLDVYDNEGDFITSVGASGYQDYPSYLEMEARGEIPKGYANKRKDMYWNRHGKEIQNLGDEWKGSRSYYAFMLLWS